MSKTTIVAILIAVGTLATSAAHLLNGGSFDLAEVLKSVLGVVTALGFKFAADAVVAK